MDSHRLLEREVKFAHCVCKSEAELSPCETVRVSAAYVTTELECEHILDAQAHARTAREGNEPVVQLTRFKPAVRPEYIRFSENGRVVVNKRAAARDDCLSLLSTICTGSPGFEPTYICRYSNAVDGRAGQRYHAQKARHHT